MAKVKFLRAGKAAKKKGGREALVIPVIKLPEKKSKPSEEMNDYTWLIYGEKKIGKTSLAAEFPDCLISAFEPGTRALSVYVVPTPDWARFVGVIDAFEDEPDRFRTVAIDTADRAYEACFLWCCQKMGIEHPHDENDFGKSWSNIDREFSKQLDRLFNLGIGVIFLSHADTIEVQAASGKSHARIGTTMKKAAARYLEAVIDIWAYYHYSGKRRVLQLEGDELVSAGYRVQNNLQTTDGEPLKSIDMGRSAKEGYKNLVAAWNNELETVSADEPEEDTDTKKTKTKFRRKG